MFAEVPAVKPDNKRGFISSDRISFILWTFRSLRIRTAKSNGEPGWNSELSEYGKEQWIFIILQLLHLQSVIIMYTNLHVLTVMISTLRIILNIIYLCDWLDCRFKRFYLNLLADDDDRRPTWKEFYYISNTDRQGTKITPSARHIAE